MAREVANNTIAAVEQLDTANAVGKGEHTRALLPTGGRHKHRRQCSYYRNHPHESHQRQNEPSRSRRIAGQNPATPPALALAWAVFENDP